MSAADPPLPASTLVPALIRQVTAAGGFATLVARGSPWGGALLIVHRHGGTVRAQEKLPGLDGRPVWRIAAEGEEAVAKFLERQRKFDPDLWIVELDIADAAQFVPGIVADMGQQD